VIHRTCQGSIPSGGPEAGRSIKQFGDIFVEWSGVEPQQADLDAHLSPPAPPAPLSAEELFDMLKAKGALRDQDRPRPRP
jgi:hypothetical protein